MRGSAVHVIDPNLFAASSQSDTAHQEYLDERIPESSFFDISAISDQSSSYPDMLPRAEEFANQVMEVCVLNSLSTYTIFVNTV